jgi:hypothetical protein
VRRKENWCFLVELRLSRTCCEAVHFPYPFGYVTQKFLNAAPPKESFRLKNLDISLDPSSVRVQTETNEEKLTQNASQRCKMLILGRRVVSKCDRF